MASHLKRSLAMNLFPFHTRTRAAVAAPSKAKKVTPPELKAIAGDPELMRVACETLVSAYRKGGGGAGIDWTDLDLAARLAAAGLGESLEAEFPEDDLPFLVEAE
jgi:hypothetical protein